MKIILVLILPLTSNVFSQVAQQWVAQYNGQNAYTDEVYSMALDAAGNIYVTGRSFVDTPTVYHDYVTIKYNSAGVLQWLRKYNGPGLFDDIAQSITVDGSGNVYVTGQSWGNDNIRFDYATIKYNSSGVLQWAVRYNGSGSRDDAALSVAVDNSGNVFVTGYSYVNSTFDYITIKYNSSGALLWSQGYNGPGSADDRPKSMVIDASANVYVAGYSFGSGSSYDFTLIKYNSSGVQQWVQRYNGPANVNDYVQSLTLDYEGNVYVTGNSEGIGTSFDYATIKYNPSGSLQWLSRYDGPPHSSDISRSVEADVSGNIFVTGNSKSGTTYGTDDYATVKYNSSGVQQWVARYNGTGNFNDYANSLAIDGSGNIYVTGNSRGGGTRDDFTTIKYNPSGTEQWVQRYNGTGNEDDLPRKVLVDNSGNVYVSGKGAQGVTGNDYTTVKYSQTIGIQIISTEIPNQFSLSQNYPNPFNPNTKIQFALSKSSFAKLVIYDVLGRELETLVSEQLTAGTYEADWSADKFSNGVYYYKLTVGDFSETKKMVLMK